MKVTSKMKPNYSLKATSIVKMMEYFIYKCPREISNVGILVTFVDICTLPFYAIIMDDMSLFTYSSFLFLANLDLHCIDVLYQFE